MKASKQTLSLLQEAATPFVWIDTNEYHRVIDLLLSLPAPHVIYLWDPFSGCRSINVNEADKPPQDIDSGMGSPVQAIDYYCSRAAESFQEIMCLLNAGNYVDNPTFQMAVVNSYDYMASTGKTVFMVAPLGNDLPKVLQPYITVTSLALPDVQVIKDALVQYTQLNEVPNTLFSDIDSVANAAKGLTLTELLTAVQFLLTQRETELVKKYATDDEIQPRLVITPRMMSNYKANLVSSRLEGVSLYTPKDTDTFDYIIGLTNVKTFVTKMALSGVGKGSLLLGVPGNAKSMLAKALGNEINWTVIKLDLTGLFHHLVGSSERRVRTALQNIESLSPCVVWMDEIEKALSIPQASNDGGVTSKIVSVLLQWLDEPHDNIYVVATSNNVLSLPPEFVRSERWDSMFFVDYPTPQARKKIWELWLDHYKLNINLPTPNDDKWSGADIKACCRLAAALKTTPVKASKYVVPVASTFDTTIQALRDWASTRTVIASWDVELETDSTGKNNIVTLPRFKR